MSVNKFDSLQCFRGLAALGVVLHHSSVSTNAFIQAVPKQIDQFCYYGFLGVDFFFVLSGFIILSSHFNDDKTIGSLKTYIQKRFVRIFPPYWPVSVTLIILYSLLPNMSEAGRIDRSLLSSLLLLPAAAPPALSVAWTLIHEMIFYMFFCLFFYSQRLFITAVTCWVFAIFAVNYSMVGLQLSPALAVLLNPINLEFVIGMAIAYLAKTLSGRHGMMMICLGCIMFGALLYFPVAMDYRFLFGFPFAALVLGGVWLEMFEKISLPAFLVKLGDASYSIYLIHNPLLSATGRLIGRFLGLKNWFIGLVFGIIASVVIGFIYHHIVEKPLIRFFRSRIIKK